MGNVSSSTKSKSVVHTFNGDITRQDIVENTASVLEHLVCAPVSVTFKAIHCQGIHYFFLLLLINKLLNYDN